MTGISKLETFDESAHGMSTDNKLVMFDLTGLPTEIVLRELVTCFRKVVDDGGTIHAELYGEPPPNSSSWTEQHEVGGGVILLCNYIIRHLPSTYMTRSSVC